MIKNELKLNKNNLPIITQKIIVICDDCKKETNMFLYSQIKGLKNYGKDLCRSCKQKQQIKLGTRGKQYINVAILNRIRTSGKTFIELYGKEKADKLLQKYSDNKKGNKNPNYGGIWHGINHGSEQKGKTIDEIHGKEKSDIIRKKISDKVSGKNNPMYGKPSPSGSGNGWSGWYEGWFFRSLLELSYMVNVIERFNLKWENAEKSKYKIEYFDYKGTPRTYYPDFLVEGKYLVEIKPKRLWNSSNVKDKKDAAVIFCEKNNFKYKLISPRKLTFDEINLLVEQTKIKFTDRYKMKFDKLKK